MEKKIVQPKAPVLLQRTQEWFGSIIERPIDRNSAINPQAPSGLSICEEAVDFIQPSPTLKPHQRIEIYNQQYWWRLLSILQENFPLLTRLFGYIEFNERIATPFICHYRPTHWSLAHLGTLLPEYLKSYYAGNDKRLVVHAATLDNAYGQAFIAKQLPSINLKDAGNCIMNMKLCLQPHITLYQLPYNLFSFRDAVIQQKSGDHFMDNPFPMLEKGDQFFILFRTLHNQLSWKQLSSAQYRILNRFASGNSAAAVCDWLETQNTEYVEEALENLHLWFQEWIINGWLTFNVECGDSSPLG
jgi:hypothetical protein